MSTRWRAGAASAVVTGTVVLALFGGTATAAAPGEAPTATDTAATAGGGHAVVRAATPASTAHPEHAADPGEHAADHAHDRFQPAYARHRVVTYRPFVGEQDSRPARPHPLYEVEYPTGWEQRLARPLCTYCDHNGNGKDAWDFHDHVLGELPSRAENRSGQVFWHVYHVSPAYTGDARHDAAVSARYAALLPATSAQEVRALLRARLADGSPVAKNLDTGFTFRGPLTRWPR